MNEDNLNINLNEDDNAVDEFYAQKFFKRKISVMRDVTNKQTTCPKTLNIEENTILTHKSVIRKCIFIDSTNADYTKKYEDEKTASFKRKCSEQNCENVEKKVKVSQINQQVDENACFVLYDRISHCDYVPQPCIVEEQSPDSLARLDNIYSTSKYIVSLSIPANGYNTSYANQIAVPVPCKSEKLLKIDHESVVWSAMIETAKIETRILSVPCRDSCSPRQQFSLTPKLQYKSDCLINAYHSVSSDFDLFCKAILKDGVNKISRKHPNQSHQYMSDSINLCHFHELHLEKLPCNQLFDFMPQNKDLSGSILGGFINGLFDLSKHIYLPSEVIHVAVDYIYAYLSRVQDVPLSDLKLVTVAAIWVAAKFEGLQYHKQICMFSDFTWNQLKHAELQLLMVIDVNLTKPNAINFRNRYIIIESSTSIISHISNFVLDMTLHCYTVMILPSSKRAAAALWLSRLIQKFEYIRFNDDLHNEDLRATMESVWPWYYQELTGYHHSDISQLAIKMHVIVLALLCRGQQKNPSVNSCYNKYSNETYKNLTASYEKFTARIVYFGSALYCDLYGFAMSDWMEEKEHETLAMTVCECRPSLRRSKSCYCQQSRPDLEANSCPELTRTPLALCGPSRPLHDKATLRKLDSGYSTCSNPTADSH